MSHIRAGRWMGGLSGGLALGLTLAMPAASAQAQSREDLEQMSRDELIDIAADSQASGEAGPNTGKLSFSAGVDYVSEYWFRGIAQENQGFIAQPYANVGVELIEKEDWGVDATFGTWNSFHFENTGADGEDDFFFESDLSAGFSFDLPAGFGASISYINLYGPSGGDEFAEEIDLGVSYDDSEWWGDTGFALNPSATLAYEIDGGSDLGSNKGTYLGLSLSPSLPLNPEADRPITVGLPMTLGLGLDDYYEDGLGNDDTYGFFDIGLTASMPLTDGPTDYGSWSISGGVHYINLGDSAAQIGQPGVSGNGGFNVIPEGEDDSVYFTLGISMEY